MNIRQFLEQLHSIEKKDGYLLIRVEGEVSFAVLNTIIWEVMSRSDYHTTSSIWDLAGGFPAMKFDEFSSLTATVRSRLIKGVKGRKTAIVAATGFGVEMAGLWSKMAEPFLPFKIRSFRSFEDAEKWVLSERVGKKDSDKPPP